MPVLRGGRVMTARFLVPPPRTVQALGIGRGTALSSRVRAGRSEQGVAMLVMFVVAYNLPQFWFGKVLPGVETRSASGEHALALILVLAAAFAFVNLRCDPMPFVDLARAEPLLPAFLLLATTSALWSAAPLQTFEVSLSLIVVMLFGYWLMIRFSLGEIIGLATIVTSIGAFMHAGMVWFRPELGAGGRGWLGLLDHRNNLGASCAMALLLCLLSSRIFPRYRLFAWAMAVANVLLVFRTSSKTALVTIVVIPLMLLAFTAFRARRTLYAVVVIAMTAGSAAVAALALGNLDAVTAALDRDPNLTGRTEIWEATIPIIATKPLLGYGWAGYFTGWDGPSRPLILQFRDLPHVHNAVLEHALHLGVIGATLSVLVFVRLIVRGARVVRYYEGAAGLFPLVFGGYVLLQSISEPGVISRGLPFLLFVVAVSAAGRGRRDVLAAHHLTGAHARTSRRRAPGRGRVVAATPS